MPKVFIKAICDLEKLMNELWEKKEERDKLSKSNSKSLTTLRQKIRKYNREFDEQINDYKQVLCPPPLP